MADVPEIISAMRAAAPAGQHRLNDESLGELRGLTRALMTARPGAAQECARFTGVRERSIDLPEPAVAAWLGGAAVLVTGGTGCVGSTLLAQVARRRPRRLVSVSRGSTARWPRIAGAEYAHADVRDRCALAAIFDEVRPDVVFHLAAQRDPALAEREVHRTVTTAVRGTRNVISAAEEFGVAQVVSASTGKALRPYSREVYTASKRAAEWLLSTAASSGRARYSAARFTHMVDNSIVYRRLLDWSQGGVIRLHDADIRFYAESALESAQLMLCAGLGARPGALRVYALTDLGWPISLLDLALGVLQRTGSPAPIYLSGFDPGYESAPFPALYDPRTAGEVSPLLSAFEAVHAERPGGERADAFGLRLASGVREDELLLALEDACDTTTEPAEVRAALDELSWSLLDATLRATPCEVLARAVRLTVPHENGLSPAHRRMLAAMRQHAGVGSSVVT